MVSRVFWKSCWLGGPTAFCGIFLVNPFFRFAHFLARHSWRLFWGLLFAPTPIYTTIPMSPNNILHSCSFMCFLLQKHICHLPQCAAVCEMVFVFRTPITMLAFFAQTQPWVAPFLTAVCEMVFAFRTPITMLAFFAQTQPWGCTFSYYYY